MVYGTDVQDVAMSELVLPLSTSESSLNGDSSSINKALDGSTYPG